MLVYILLAGSPFLESTSMLFFYLDRFIIENIYKKKKKILKI